MATKRSTREGQGLPRRLTVAQSDELFDEWHPGFDDPEYLDALTRAADAAMDAAARLK